VFFFFSPVQGGGSVQGPHEGAVGQSESVSSVTVTSVSGEGTVVPYWKYCADRP
jgi:hypothetical protein